MRRGYPTVSYFSEHQWAIGQKMMRLHRWTRRSRLRGNIRLDGQKGQIFTVPLLDEFPLHPNGEKLEDMPKFAENLAILVCRS